MRILFWLPAVLWAILLFWLSSQSALPGVAPDYVSHFVAYAILASSCALGLEGRVPLGLGPRVAFQSWLLATAYGLTDEFHQMYVPGRSASWTDVLADSLGALAAVVLLARMHSAAGKGKRQAHG